MRPSRPKLLRAGDQEALLSADDGARLSFEQLYFQPSGARARGSLDEAYRRGLFAVVFDESFYRGYVAARSQLSVDFGARLTTPRRLLSPPALVLPSARALSTTRASVAIAAWVVSGAATAGAIASAVLMRQAERDFDASALQRDGWQAADRYSAFRALTIVSSVLSAVLLITGFGVWPWSL